MNVLFIASRAPWPPVDGGRVLMANTIDGLLARGHTITVVTPTQDLPAAGRLPGQPRSEQLRVVLVPDQRPARWSAAVRSLVQGQPVSVVTQASAPTRVEVARCLEAERYDVVHVEQVQALPQAEAAFGRVPVVLRAENVESDLWHALGAARPLLRPLIAFEARRLARFETRAVTRVAAAVALTESDATRLRHLSPRAAVDVVRAPMAAGLPAGDRLLEGDPPLVVVASRWLPNQEGVTWFAREVWPSILSAIPGARLHLFGADSAGSRAGVVMHEAPAESRDAFAMGAILIVPLRIASGVRVRILEAWSRGVPVVATRAAIDGLDVKDGLGVRVADSADAFVRALTELRASPEAQARLVRDGRALLAERHDPDTCAAQLEAIYRRVTASVSNEAS